MKNAENALKWEELNLDYEGENKYASFFSSTGNLHTYPAKAVPEMVSDLIKKVMSIKSIKTVLDPFVGSGTTCVACRQLGVRSIGIDMEEDYLNIAKKRIADYSNERVGNIR